MCSYIGYSFPFLLNFNSKYDFYMKKYPAITHYQNELIVSYSFSAEKNHDTGLHYQVYIFIVRIENSLFFFFIFSYKTNTRQPRALNNATCHSGAIKQEFETKFLTKCRAQCLLGDRINFWPLIYVTSVKTILERRYILHSLA